MRDAAFSLYALLRLGFTEEAGAFMDWLEGRFRYAADRQSGPLQIMYGIDGREDLAEEELSRQAHAEGRTSLSTASTPCRVSQKPDLVLGGGASAPASPVRRASWPRLTAYRQRVQATLVGVKRLRALGPAPKTASAQVG
jgi:hypothetical protein